MIRREKINRYRDLLVWQKGMALAKQVYSLAQFFPFAERFGLVAQMRRAAVSVPSDIAEGQARHGKREFVQSLSHAEGSLAELDTQLALTIQFGYPQDPHVSQSIALGGELQRMLACAERLRTG